MCPLVVFNTATALARAIRAHTGYARANNEAHTLVRQALTGSGDIDPGDGTLTVRLDPLPTGRATAAIAQLCEHLTATQTCYPGTNLILRYEVKILPSSRTDFRTMSGVLGLARSTPRTSRAGPVARRMFRTLPG